MGYKEQVQQIDRDLTGPGTVQYGTGQYNRWEMSLSSPHSLTVALSASILSCPIQGGQAGGSLSADETRPTGKKEVRYEWLGVGSTDSDISKRIDKR